MTDSIHGVILNFPIIQQHKLHKFVSVFIYTFTVLWIANISVIYTFHVFSFLWSGFSTWICRATTHTDLVVRAKNLGLEVKVIHNASVMNAIGVCGLQLYRYGETISIPFFTDTWRPDSFYPKIQNNRRLGLHTLCLLGSWSS